MLKCRICVTDACNSLIYTCDGWAKVSHFKSRHDMFKKKLSSSIFMTTCAGTAPVHSLYYFFGEHKTSDFF